MNARFLYVFLDEGGNFDFSANGTPYFIMTAMVKERPFEAYKALYDLKYDLTERGYDLEYFHATEDKQDVRNQVFSVIASHLEGCCIHSVIVEKRKTVPALWEPAKFYPRMLGFLVRHVLRQHNLRDYSNVLVFTDSIPIQKRRKAIEGAIKVALNEMLPSGTDFRILHHDSKSCPDLQVVDYCNWAIYRKWDRKDDRSYEIIRPAIQSEFDIFRRGKTWYY